MKTGKIIDCVALDTQPNEAKVECIKVDLNAQRSLVILDEIAQLEVCIDNPHFQRISFL